MQVYTVSQITAHLKGLLAQDPILQDAWVGGEVSNLRVSQSGHAYFTLKDADSQLNCVMFRRSAGIKILADGAAITAHGRLSLYEVRGSLDFITDIVVSEGVGPLALEFERLKQSLEREGLFDPSRKRPLPHFPKYVGLVTSPAGAVLHDVIQVLSRRYPLAEVLLSPTPVQGPEAAPAIVNALTRLFLDGRADVIIVARGGGSMEELWPFNEEAVARAIYASPIPVISAVGHETDFTIADFVADLRAPTPSAAAELVAPHKAALRQEVDANLQRLHAVITDQNAQRRYALSRLVSDLDYRIPDFATLRRRVDDLSQRSSTSTASFLTLRNRETASFVARLQTLDPAATLSRGYAVVHKQPKGQPIYSCKDVKAGDNLNVIVSDGAFSASVQGSQPPVRRRRKAVPKAAARLFP